MAGLSGAVIVETVDPQPHMSSSMSLTCPSARSAGTGKVVGIRAQWEASPFQLYFFFLIFAE